VHESGTDSWVLREAASEVLHIALRLRDGADLPVPAAPDIPPATEHRIPISLSPATDRGMLAAEWAVWWRRLVRHETTAVPEAPDAARGSAPGTAFTASAVRRHEAVFDPPGFASLADLPGLRALAVVHHETAVQDRARADRGRPAFDQALVRGVAARTAVSAGVPAGRLSACVAVLDVDGAWSYLTGSGGALCSRAVVADPEACARLLHDVFLSGLTGEQA
jgi:hypothetical protein